MGPNLTDINTDWMFGKDISDPQSSERTYTYEYKFHSSSSPEHLSNNHHVQINGEYLYLHYYFIIYIILNNIVFVGLD